MRIEGSVGLNGDNLKADVSLVQRLLNRHDLAPLSPLREDGSINAHVITAVRHFQARYVGMNSPDGRVDADGKTFRCLTRGSSERGRGESVETRQADRRARTQYVDPRVKETGVTSRIIDQLVPYLAGVRAKIIAGYLSDADQFWKINYHWEYLLGMVEHALTLPLQDDTRKAIQAVRSSLLASSPNPASGYTSGGVGRPEDKSPLEDIGRRHKVLTSGKQAFKRQVDSAALKDKSGRSAHAFDLAVAPIAFPGTSKHGTGYALDIEGDNGAIKSICRAHGATLVFDEKSHVHVEFKNGVA